MEPLGNEVFVLNHYLFLLTNSIYARIPVVCRTHTITGNTFKKHRLSSIDKCLFNLASAFKIPEFPVVEIWRLQKIQ